MSRRIAACVALLVASFATTALAAPLVTISAGIEGDMWYAHDEGTAAGNDTWDVNGQWSGDLCDVTWNLIVKEDPFIDLNVTMKNSTASTQSYVVTVTLPITPAITGGTLIGGSTSASFTDANGNGGVTVSTYGGNPFFAGLIDGLTELEIHTDPSSWSAPFGSGTISPVNIGLPVASSGIAGPSDALNTIAITHRFTLSPGDTIALTSYFEVIPEPASLTLLGLGALAMLRRRAA